MNSIAKLILTTVASLAFLAQSSAAHEDERFNMIAEHADNVFCEADKLRDLFREELRGTKCYPKLQVTTAMLKSTSARVRRRARTIKIAKWDREFDRLDSLICELDELLKETYDRSARGLERPLADCTIELTEAMAIMNNGVACMRALCQSVAAEVNQNINFRSPYTESFLNQPAPGFQPAPLLNAPVAPAPGIPQNVPSGSALPPSSDSVLPPLTVPKSILVPDSSNIPDPLSVPKSTLIPKPMKRPPVSLIPRSKNRVVPATANMPFDQTLKFAPPADVAKSVPTKTAPAKVNPATTPAKTTPAKTTPVEVTPENPLSKETSTRSVFEPLGKKPAKPDSKDDKAKRSILDWIVPPIVPPASETKSDK